MVEKMAQLILMVVVKAGNLVYNKEGEDNMTYNKETKKWEVNSQSEEEETGEGMNED